MFDPEVLSDRYRTACAFVEPSSRVATTVVASRPGTAENPLLILAYPDLVEGFPDEHVVDTRPDVARFASAWDGDIIMLLGPGVEDLTAERTGEATGRRAIIDMIADIYDRASVLLLPPRGEDLSAAYEWIRDEAKAFHRPEIVITDAWGDPNGCAVPELSTPLYCHSVAKVRVLNALWDDILAKLRATTDLDIDHVALDVLSVGLSGEATERLWLIADGDGFDIRVGGREFPHGIPGTRFKSGHVAGQHVLEELDTLRAAAAPVGKR